jgi:hypothetical protein
MNSTEANEGNEALSVAQISATALPLSSTLGSRNLFQLKSNGSMELQFAAKCDFYKHVSLSLTPRFSGVYRDAMIPQPF